MKCWIPLVATAWAAEALAHHSFASVYDTSQEVTLEGVVKAFQFVHPHPILVIQVGTGETWRAEMDNRFELADIGVTATTFKPGNRVRVSGSPGRTEAHMLYLWKLERPADGLRYAQIGARPTIQWPKRN